MSSPGTGASCEPDEARARRQPEAYVGIRRGLAGALATKYGDANWPRDSGLVEPDSLEAIQQGGRVLLEALDRGLGEIDRVGGEQPEVRHVLEDHDLHAVVDLLALLGVHGAAAVLEESVDLGHAPAVPVLPLRGV